MSASGLGQLLHDLALAWRAISAYPPGHQAATDAVRRAHGSLTALLAENGTFDLIAARDALMLGDERHTGMAAERLAELLRKRGAAGVQFDSGVEIGELEQFLRALLVDARRARAAGSIAKELEAAGVSRIRVRDLDFSGFGLVEDDGPEAILPEAGGLWERLARRLVAGGQVPTERLASWIAGGRSSTDLIGALLGRVATGPAGEIPWRSDALDGLLAAAATELVEGTVAGSARGVSTLWSMLAPPLRTRLEEAVATTLRKRGGGESALTAWRTELPDEAVAGIGEALARASALSPSAPAQPSVPQAAPALEAAGLSRLRDFFAGEDLDAAALLSDEAGARVEARLDLEPSRAAQAVGAALVALGAEAGAASALDRSSMRAFLELVEQPSVPRESLPGLLERLEAVYRRQLEEGRWGSCLDLVARVRRLALGEGESAEGSSALLERLAGRDAVDALVAGLRTLDSGGSAEVRRLVEGLGRTAVRNLLEVLAHEEDRARRHRLLDLLAGLGPAVVRDASALLADSRWYVVRNMLVLLRRVGDPGSVPAVRRCCEHADLRVRLEAIRNLFAFDQELPRELLRRAIRNSDPRLAEEAIDLAASRGIVEAIDPLVALLQRWDPLGGRRALRLKAIRALGEFADPRALAGLRHFVARFRLFPVAAEEKRALFQTLGRYPEEARRPFVERGRKLRDPEIRRLATRLAEAGAGR